MNNSIIAHKPNQGIKKSINYQMHSCRNKEVLVNMGLANLIIQADSSVLRIQRKLLIVTVEFIKSSDFILKKYLYFSLIMVLS